MVAVSVSLLVTLNTSEEGIVSECLRGLCPDENHPHSEGGTRYKRFRNRRTKRRRNRRTRRRR